MNDLARRRTGTAVAALLAADAMLHAYWATGLTWPGHSSRAVSEAVLGADVPLTPQGLLPLCALLLTAAALVRARGLGLGSRRTRPLYALATLAVAVGMLVRGTAGVVWATGIGVDTGSAFYLLNLLLYTPLCLGFGAATARLVTSARPGRPVWPRRVAVVLPLLLTGGLLYGAYGYAPGEQRGYRPAGPAAADSHFVDTPLARFHYVRRGTGSPVVLLSPGAAWTFAWQPEIDVLARTHTVYAVDLPGQGFTELRDRHFSWDLPGMTAAIGSFLDAEQLPQVALAGNSWSGGWALAYAQQHPQRVSRLALLAPSGLDERDTPSWEALKLPVLGELAVNFGSTREVAAASVRSLFAHQELVTDQVVDAMWAPNTLAENRRSMYRLERGLDWSRTQAALPQTRQPVLLLWGTQDTTLPVAQAARFGRLLPAATVHVLDGCGHALTLDCAPQVSGLMEDFLHD